LTTLTVDLFLPTLLFIELFAV